MSTAVDFNVTMGQLRNALVEIDAATGAERQIQQHPT